MDRHIPVYIRIFVYYNISKGIEGGRSWNKKRKKEYKDIIDSKDMVVHAL
jgi:hypothetical protein